MEPRIAPVSTNDLPVLNELVKKEFSYLDVDKFPFESKLSNPDFLLYKTVSDGVFSGFIECEWIESWTVRMNGLVVAQGFRRQGLARTLLEFSLSELKKRGVESVVLIVAHDNAAAKKLYSEFGFSFDSIWSETIQGKEVEYWRLVFSSKPFVGVI